MKVLVVDNHEVSRLGIRLCLTNTDIEIVSEATSAEEALSSLCESVPDAVLLDVRLQGTDGLKVLGRIKFDHPDLPVVFLSAYDNPTYIARAYALGAAGYVLKSDPSERLIGALKTALHGEPAWTSNELRRLTGALAAPRIGQDLGVSLTQREAQVLHKVALGLTNKEIAKTLGVSYETVKEHVQHILRKLGVKDRTQAAVWAVRNGLA